MILTQIFFKIISTLQNTCVCYFKNGVWPWTMEWFNAQLTNKSHSFSACILEISNVYIRLILSVYECNNGLLSKHVYNFSRSHFLVKVMSRSNKYSKPCILWCIIGMPNMNVINIIVIEILQKRSHFGWE